MITFDYSSSSHGITHTDAFFDALSDDVVSVADKVGNPTSSKTSIVPIPNSDGDEVPTAVPVVFAGSLYGQHVGKYVPTDQYVYKVDIVDDIGFQLTYSADPFPDINDYVADSYDSLGELGAAANAYKAAAIAWYQKVHAATVTEGAIGDKNGIFGTVHSDTPIAIGDLTAALFIQDVKIIGSEFGDIIEGGSGDNTIIANGGDDTITIDSDGTNIVTAGSGIDTITVSSAGTDNSVNTGSGGEVLSIDGGGNLKVVGAFEGSATIGDSSTLEFNASASGGAITFDFDSTLKIDGTTMPTNVITGFGTDDTIYLAGVPYVHGKVGVTGGIAFLSPGNVLNIVEGGTSYKLNLDQNFAGQSFTLTPDEDGGTDVTLTTDPTLLQYLLFSDLVYGLTPSGFFSPQAARFPDYDDTPAGVRSILEGFTAGPEMTDTDGLTAIAFVDDEEGTANYKDVVIAFRGSVTEHDWRVADAQLAVGIKPAEFDAAVNFVTQQVETIYEPSDGYSYFVTGHSLGAAEAEDVAAVLGFGGDTFAAPGIGQILTAGGVISNGANLTDYVIATDPVGNHTTLSGDHVGTVIPLPSVHFTSDLFGLFGGPLGFLVGLQEHRIGNYGQALANAHLIPSNPLPIPAQSTSASPIFEDLRELDPDITDFATQTDGADDVIETGSESVVTDLGDAIETISEEVTANGETILSLTLTSGTQTVSEVATLTSAGLVSETIILNGVKISAPSQSIADIDVAQDGTILVKTSSSTAGQELTLDALIDGSYKIYAGGDSQTGSQVVGSFSAQGLSSVALTLSALGTPGFNEDFSASTGNHTVNGSGGVNTIDYSSLASSGLVAILQGGHGIVNKGDSNGLDTLTKIQGVLGTTGGDVFYVDANETVSGVSGFDYLIELSAGVNLAYSTNFTGISEFVSNVGTNILDFSNDPNFAYVYGSTGNDTLTLGAGGGYLFGEGGSNTLNGGANAVNVFEGGSGGSDTMNGGSGTASNYYFIDGNDQVNGAGAFNAVIELVSDVTVQLGSAQYQHVQEFVANSGTNVATVAASDGDLVYLYGGAGNDTLTTGSGGGYLIGEGGTNTLTGGGATNIFIADNASGIDTMNGGTGSNLYYIDSHSIVHGAGTFNNVIELQQNASLTLGSAQLGTDVQQVIFNGGTNSADFHTATSAVFLYGGSGNDTLFGGTGDDFLYGGTGTNTFAFASGWGKDTIEDWTAGTNSQIDLTALAGLGVHAISDLTQTITGSNDVITSSHTGTNSITLLGVGAALTTSSFHFA